MSAQFPDPSARRSRSLPGCCFPAAVWVVLLVMLGFGVPQAHADPSVSDWQPLFKGIDLIRGTNTTASGDFQNRMVMYCLRVDLRDPDIRLHPSPRIDGFVPGSRETAGMTVSRFVETQGVQVAVNANFFNPQEYYLPEGTPMSVSGLQISGGLEVSPQSNSQQTASVFFDATNRVTVVHTNWPPVSTAGVLNAVTGDYPVVVNGINIGRQYLNQPGSIHDTQPRTAIGASLDRRFLYLMCIDGRQSHSTGALDHETGAWMLLVGAHDAVNMDGGGSATMAMESSVGTAMRINLSSAAADSGKERTVGSHLGVFARPLPGFINDLTAIPDDVSASISWTTTGAASTQLEYGPTMDLGQTLAVQAASSTSHAALIRGLSPGTEYFYRAVSVSAVDGTVHTSMIRRMVTVNYAVPQEVIPINGSWRFFAGTLDGQPWVQPSFNDSTWSGPGNGILWAHATRNNPAAGVEPVGTRITSINGATGFPYTTYYFRTHFDLPAVAPGTQLRFVGRIDDGAVVYLNGKELQRIRMADAPTEISSSTFALGFGCSGDATCDEVFEATGDGFLAAGDNVLAVEVHNYNARSTDITFGLSMAVAQPRIERPELRSVTDDAGSRIEWTRGGFLLQEAPSPAGPWTDVAGPVVVSPYRISPTSESRLYRLAR